MTLPPPPEQPGNTFQLMVEASSYAMLLVDPKGSILFANNQTQTLFGYNSGELTGKLVETLIPEGFGSGYPPHSGNDRISPQARSISETRSLFAQRKDRSVFPVEISLNPIKTAQGNTLIVASVVDITERKLAEKVMRDSEERFRLTIDSIKDHAIFLMDPEGRVISWNSGAERIKGYRAEEILGKNYSCFYTAEDSILGKPAAHLKIARETGRFEEENWRVRKDGSVFLGSILITPMYGDNQELLGFSKVTRDVTERKLAEERFRLAVEAAPNAMIMVGQNGAITYANAQSETLFGYDRRELVGKSLEALVPERFRGRHAGYRETYFQQPSTRSMGAGRDLFGLKKDETEIPIEIGLNPIKTTEGTFVLASIIDITERKRLAYELQTFEKMSALGVMAAGVAHELNNPMMGILNFVQYAIKNLAEDHKLYPVLKDTEHEILRCTKIIMNLLTFAHAEKRDEAFYQNRDLCEIVDRAINRLMPRIQAEQVRLEKSGFKETVEIRANAEGLEQVFLNLVSNALDAVNENDSRILRVEIRKERDMAAAFISDNGPGIPPEIITKIFDPFFTTKPPGKGTGLGLSICRSIVRDHQGEINYESYPGEGSTFKVSLPAGPSSKRSGVSVPYEKPL